MSTRSTLSWFVSITLLIASGLRAEEKQEQDGDESSLTAGWDGSHPFIKSSDGNFEMEFGGRIHLDYRAYGAEFAPKPSFVLRRARMEVEGAFYNFVEFKIQADFSDDESALLRDGFINIHPTDAAQVMAGQFKAPFSQEEIQSSKFIEFVERSMLNNLAPSRSPGVMFHGSAGAGLVDYAVSVQNDQGELGLHETDTPDVFGYTRLHPFREGVLKNLSFGGALAHGRREGERFIVGRTSSRSVVFFDRLPLDGALDRYNLEGWWFHKNMKIQAEYTHARGERELLPDIEGGGFYVQGNYVLTGEVKEGDGPIVPKRSVHEGGWGAWEVGARYQKFEVDGFNRATDLTLGVNWWMNPFVRFMANFAFEDFRKPPDPTTGETRNFAFVSRLALFF